MNINIIKNALEKYLLAAENDDEKRSCAKALEELACVMDRYESADSWDNDVVMLPTAAWVDILDAMTYDILGKRMKAHGSGMRPEYYYHDVRSEYLGMQQIASMYLAYGYEVLHELWMENEALGCHDDKGCYKGEE